MAEAAAAWRTSGSRRCSCRCEAAWASSPTATCGPASSRRAPPVTPIELLATFPVRTIAGDTLAGDALLAMFAQGVHHFPVSGEDGKLVGVVTDTDLMGIGRHTPFAMKSAIERAPAVDAVAAAGRELPEVVATMVRSRRRSDRRRPRRRPRRRRDDRAADPARDRRPRRPPERLGLARPRERRPSRAGAAHRPGPRARLRPSGRACRRGPVLRRHRRARDGGTRGRGHPPVRRGRDGGAPDAATAALDDFAEAVRDWMDRPDAARDRAFVDRLRLPAGGGPARRRAHARRRDAAGAAAPDVRAPDGPTGARPASADRVPARSGRRGLQERTRGASTSSIGASRS